MVDDEKSHEDFFRNNDKKYAKYMEIWEDELNMIVLNGNQLLVECEEE